ncbi:PspC domain-containing protein [Actinoplanes missouriensis]|uniref:PspC domain-containing protein n=1 Tax=Actinoplanes missouriensis TaxID=1866 RepID=UPI0033E3D982
MNDEAAQSRGPSTPGAGPQGAEAPSSPDAGAQPSPDAGAQPETAPEAQAETTSAAQPDPPAEPWPGPPPGAHAGPAAGPQPGPAPGPQAGPPPGWQTSANVPPWLAGASAAFDRQQLVRPRNGRYIAGVCGALARATNTDPVLWRVLLGVLGILGGTGVLLYLIGWLIIPSEGDTASPVESLLGKGHSGMAPLSVVLLGSAALLTFAFIVNSGARASMLAAAVVLGAFLLIKRGGVSDTTRAATTAPPSPPPPTAVPEEPTMAFTAPVTTPGAAPGQAPAEAPGADPGREPGTGAGAWPAEPVTGAGAWPAEPVTGAGAWPAEPVTAPPAPSYEPPLFAPPAEGYRPPFAPHGPYASGSVPPQPPQPPKPAKPAKPPKPPRERSVLGRLTFFAVVVVMGLLAVLDMAGVNVVVSAYFAAALTTIALGLIVGSWFGRARGLIALALIATLGLFVSTGTERWGGEFRDSVYRPTSLSELADRYDFTFGNVTLDLSEIDFTGAQQHTTVDMKIGQLRVVLPPEVDTTVDVTGGGVRTVLFGTESASSDENRQTVTDLGADGAGGGTLQLDLRLDTGNVEVSR